MTLSLDPEVRDCVSGAKADASDHDGSSVSRIRTGFRRYGIFLVAWAVLSIFWTGYIAYDLYRRAQVQAEMARDVERDLDQGLVAVSCDGPRCEDSQGGSTEQWADIASTYVRFGSTEMSESILAPPALMLVVGLAVIFVRGRRRRPN